MPRGDKPKYTDKQKRKVGHIEESYEKRGVPEDEAERRAWATVNKDQGSRKGGASASRSQASKSESAANTAETRKRNFVERRAGKTIH